MRRRFAPVAGSVLVVVGVLGAPRIGSAAPAAGGVRGAGNTAVGRLGGRGLQRGVVMGSRGFGSSSRGFTNGFSGRFGFGFGSGFGSGFNSGFHHGFGRHRFGCYPYSGYSSFGYPYDSFGYGGFPYVSVGYPSYVGFFGAPSFLSYPGLFGGFDPYSYAPSGFGGSYGNSGYGSPYYDLTRVYERISEPPGDSTRPYSREDREWRNSYSAPEDRPRPRDGDAYYLEPRRDPTPANPIEAAKRRLRVAEADRGVYLVRWSGPAQELKTFELQAVDGKGEELHAKLLQEPPFRTLLRVPAGAASVLLTLTYRNGTSLALKLPAEEFRSLAGSGTDSGAE